MRNYSVTDVVVRRCVMVLTPMTLLWVRNVSVPVRVILISVSPVRNVGPLMHLIGCLMKSTRLVTSVSVSLLWMKGCVRCLSDWGLGLWWLLSIWVLIRIRLLISSVKLVTRISLSSG